jgi:hypothetical protein
MSDAVFICDKCQEAPEGAPTAVLSFKDKEGVERDFQVGQGPLTFCQSCAPKLFRHIDGFLKKPT